MSKIPQFETKRLILKQVEECDYESYYKNFNDYEVIQYLSAAVPWPYPENAVKDFMEKFVNPNLGKSRWLWGIFFKESPNEVIGAVDLSREGKPKHRGFWLAKKYWKQGFMTEAVEPVMDYAFYQLGFEELIFSNAVGNEGSRRVKEKTGAKFIKTAPADFVDKRFSEQELWELKKDDWLKYLMG